MSTNSPFPDPDELPEDDREKMLSLLEQSIRECHRKAAGDGRIRDEEKESVRIKWHRSLASSVAEYRKLKADIDKKELSERIDRLERR
jgi:hypothetical protein